MVSKYTTANTISKVTAIRAYYQSLSNDDKKVYLKNLSKAQLHFHLKHPDIFAYDKQLIPGGDVISNLPFMYYLLRCGRSFGKTYSASIWIANKIRQGAMVLGLCGPTYSDVADVMVKMIQKWFLPEEMLDPPYNDKTHQLRFTNGAVIHCYTSDKEIRGPNLEFLWCDEICVWADMIPDKIKERFEDIVRTVRIGDNPQTLITSTPKPHPFFFHFQDEIDKNNPAYMMMQGSMDDNKSLSQAYIDEQKKAKGDRAKQEIYGHLIRNDSGAYWTHDIIDKNKCDLPPPPPPPDYITVKPDYKTSASNRTPRRIRTLIGFDPAVSITGDESGIIVASMYSNKEVYILEDKSGRYEPFGWATLISNLYKEYDCQGIVVEKNQGGNTLEYTFRSVNKFMKIIPIHTNQGKEIRAENASMFYNMGKVHHIKDFAVLEDQMCAFSASWKQKSPDRVDALGHVLTELFHPSSGAYNRPTFVNLPGWG